MIQYRKNYKKTYTDIAIEALDAGHDLLIFSHLNISNAVKRGRHADFDMEDLKKLVNEMSKRIRSSKSLHKKFRKSLKKIIIAKALINKRLGGSTEELLSGIRGQWNRVAIQDLANYESPEFLKKFGYEDVNEFIKEVIRNATITLNMVEKTTNFVDLAADTKIDFYIDERYLEKFINSFSDKYKSAAFYPVCRVFNTKECRNFALHDVSGKLKFSLKTGKENWLKITKQRIVDSLESNDMYRVVYTASTPDDIVVFDHARLEVKNSLLGKVMMFMHYTPTIINKELVTKMNIFGAFTKHKLSYEVDIEMLEGIFNPKPIKNLPINFGGDPDGLLRREDSLVAAEGFVPIQYHATNRERKLSEEINKLKKELSINEKVSSNDNLCKKKTELVNTAYYLTAIAIILFISIFIVIGLIWSNYSSVHEESLQAARNKKKKGVLKWAIVIIHACVKQPKIVFWLLTLLVIIVLFICSVFFSSLYYSNELMEKFVENSHSYILTMINNFSVK